MLTSLQLKQHNRFLTGSKISCLLGLPGAYQSKFELFSRMKGYINTEIEETERMKAGNYMEDAIAQWCQKEWVWDLIPGPEEGKFHPQYPFIYGLVDRLQKTDGKVSHVVEIKNQDRLRESAWADGPPESFKAQLYLYMSIYDLPGRFAVCFGGNHFESFELPRNPKIENFILKKCCEFWDDLQHDRWPEVDETASCTETLKNLYSTCGEDMIDGSEDMFDLAHQYIVCRENELQAKSGKDKCANQLKAIIGSNSGMVFNNGSKITWKKTKPKKLRFDEEKFAKEHPELYQRFLYTPDGYRRFDVRLKVSD